MPHERRWVSQGMVTTGACPGGDEVRSWAFREPWCSGTAEDRGRGGAWCRLAPGHPSENRRRMAESEPGGRGRGGPGGSDAERCGRCFGQPRPSRKTIEPMDATWARVPALTRAGRAQRGKGAGCVTDISSVAQLTVGVSGERSESTARRVRRPHSRRSTNVPTLVP